MTWLLYGANGYTGTLVARLAVARGERPVLAGRSAGKIARAGRRARARASRVRAGRSGRDPARPGRRDRGGPLRGPVLGDRGPDGQGLRERRAALSRHHRRDRGVRGAARAQRPGQGGGQRAAARRRVRRRPDRLRGGPAGRGAARRGPAGPGVPGRRRAEPWHRPHRGRGHGPRQPGADRRRHHRRAGGLADDTRGLSRRPADRRVRALGRRQHRLLLHRHRHHHHLHRRARGALRANQALGLDRLLGLGPAQRLAQAAAGRGSGPDEQRRARTRARCGAGRPRASRRCTRR